MTEDANCPNCGGPIAIRNPTGKCDHLYYPENVPGYVSERSALLRCEEALRAFSEAAGGWFMKNYNASEAVASIRVDGKYFTITAGDLFNARAALTLLDEARHGK